jgi:uroporphyrinogen III methyltransferase / synthase
VSRPTNALVLRTDDEFSQYLRSAGIEVTNLPLIRTEPLDDQSDLLRAIERIGEYDGLFFTSPEAARVFVDEWRGREDKYPGKMYVMGKRSQDVLAAAGFSTEFEGSVNTSEELITAHGAAEFAGKKLLFLRGERSLLTIPRLLAGKAIVEEVVVYRTVSSEFEKAEIAQTAERLASGEIDWLCFFSPSAIEGFIRLFGVDIKVKTATIGRTTADRAIENGLNVEFISPRSSAIDFASAFISYLNGK